MTPEPAPGRTRILATVAYAAALGAAAAYSNAHPSASDVPILALWIASPFVGFYVGRWWAAFAALGGLLGHAIGWDSGENDGNPAFWPPYVVTWLVFLGGPILLGALAATLGRRHRRAAASDPGQRAAERRP